MTVQDTLWIESGDIFCTRAHTRLGRLIRWGGRDRGEDYTVVNHVGEFTTGGPLCEALGVEALGHGVREHNIYQRYLKRQDGISIFHLTHLTPAQRRKVVRVARSYVGRRYGFVKIVAHVLDALFGRVYFFRRLCRMKCYPICSWVVAFAYAEVGVIFKGVAKEGCQPDDIWDHCLMSRDWCTVLPIQRLR